MLFKSIKENGEFKLELAQQGAVELAEKLGSLFFEMQIFNACKMNFERNYWFQYAPKEINDGRATVGKGRLREVGERVI